MAKSITSINQLAKAVGKTPPAVRKWITHPEWPFEKKGPWSAAKVKAIVAWAKQHLQEDRATEEGGRGSTVTQGDASSIDKSTAGAIGFATVRDGKIAKLEEEVIKLRKDNAERAGDTHSATECNQQQLARIQFAKEALRQVGSKAVKAIDARERATNTRLSDLDRADIINDAVDEAIERNLAPRQGR